MKVGAEIFARETKGAVEPWPPPLCGEIKHGSKPSDTEREEADQKDLTISVVIVLLLLLEE